MTFKPGQSGNPAGRATGTRNKLSEKFIEDLLEFWKENGKAAILQVYANKPEVIIQTAAKILPKDVNHFHKLDEVKNIVESELDRRIANYLGTSLPGSDGEARALPAPDGARTAH